MFFKKLLFLFLAVSFIIAPAISQEDDDFEGVELQSFKERKFDWSKAFIEPNIAFAYTNNFFSIGLAPIFGYEVAKNFYVGPGLVYYFSQVRNVEVSLGGTLLNRININQYSVGGAFMGQYYFYKQFLVRARFEMLGRKVFTDINPQTLEADYINPFVPVLLLGAGYNMSMGKTVHLPILISYDVLRDPNSPYGTRDLPLLIQIGFVSYF